MDRPVTTTIDNELYEWLKKNHITIKSCIVAGVEFMRKQPAIRERQAQQENAIIKLQDLVTQQQERIYQLEQRLKNDVS